MKTRQSNKRWLWTFSLVAVAIIFYNLYDSFHLGALLGILGPFVGGFVLAFFLYQPSKWIENRFLQFEHKAWKKLARPLSLTIVYLLFLGLLALLVYLVIPVLAESAVSLSESLKKDIPAAIGKMEGWLKSINLLKETTGNGEAVSLMDQAGTMLKDLLTFENLQTITLTVGNIASGLINAVLAFIVSIYMLSGREHLMASFRNFLSLFVKPPVVGTLRDYDGRIATIFYRYFYGAFLDALLVGVVVSVGLTIFGVPYAFLLGMSVGLLNMIPYFGAIIGGVAVALITLLTNGFYTALGVAIYIVVVQQIDANIIQPRVVGESVGLRPIYVLLSITLFGGLFGFWGVFLAPPLMAIIQLLVREATKLRYRKLAEEAAAAETSQEDE